jgi:hypothetical protein
MILTAASLTATMARPAAAQEKERPRLGGGLIIMHTDENPVGVAANVTVPVATSGHVSIGATGDFGTASFEHFQGTTIGGGVRTTFLQAPAVHPFVQFQLGMFHRKDHECPAVTACSKNDFGGALGGGVQYAVTKMLSVLGQIDLGMVKSETSNKKGMRFLVGVSVPLGGA